MGLFFIGAVQILLNAKPDDLIDQWPGHGLVQGKLNGSLAGLVGFEFLPEGYVA